MQLIDFLTRLLPSTGRSVLWYKNNGFPKNIFFDNIEQLAARLERMVDVPDVYFGTASYGGEDARTQINVVSLKTLRMDIDAGAAKFAKHPEGAYLDANAAIRAVADAIRAGMPKPSLVMSSGQGYHLYWQLDRAHTPSEWVPVAQTLQRLGEHLGLKIDSTCTVDTARVLRPVGSLHNCGNRVSVFKDYGITYELDAINKDMLGKLPELDPFEAALAARPAPKARSINDDILEHKGPPASLARVAEHCAAVQWVRDTEGNVPEPVWRGMMGVAKYTEDGQELIHPWSSGYHGYNASETQEKFERWSTPPTTCSYFVTQCGDKCAACPHKGKITTPKQLGYISNPPKIETYADTSEPAAPAKVVDEPASPALVASAAKVGDTAWSVPEGMDEDDDSEVAVKARSTDCPIPGHEYLFDPSNPFFYRTYNGRWSLFVRAKVKTTDATGQDVWHEVIKPVCHRLVWVDSITDLGATENGGTLTMIGRVNKIGGKHDRVSMPSDASASADTLTKFMHSMGVFTDPSNKDSKRHLLEFIIKEQERKQENMRLVLRNRFGYTFSEGVLLCSQGVYTVYPRGTPAGEIQRTIISTNLQSVGSALGTTCLPPNADGAWGPEVWQDHIGPAAVNYIKFLRKHYNHDGYNVARLALAASLASPLLVFTADAPMTDEDELPAVGLVVSLFSQGSGKGKSAVQEVIAAAYGKPGLKRAGKSGAITPIAANNLAHDTAIYPFILDEVTRNDAEQAAAMVDTFANGQGRVVAKRSGGTVSPSKTWALVTCLSTNVPQRELITMAQKSSDALNLRLLELDFDSLPGTGDHSTFTEDFKKLTASCGAFGLLLARSVVNLGFAKVSQMAQENMRRAYTLLDVGQEYRFFARGLAAILTMNQLLSKAAPFDEPDLVETYRQAVDAAAWTVETTATSFAGELSNFINSISANVAVTASMTSSRGPHAKHDMLHNPNVRMPLQGREVRDRGVVYVDAQSVKAWCITKQISLMAFISRAKEAGMLVPHADGNDAGRVRLSMGLSNVPTTNVQAYAFRVRLASAKAEQSVDEDAA